MRRETFKKEERITKRADFIKRLPGDRVIHTPAYRFIFKPSKHAYSRLGIVVTRRDGGAVFRNRVKRVLREAFRRHKTLIQPPSDVVVIRRSHSGKPSYQQAKESFVTAIRRWSVQKHKGNDSTA